MPVFYVLAELKPRLGAYKVLVLQIIFSLPISLPFVI